MSEYKDQIRNSLTEIGKDPLARFVGYGMLAGRAGGFLKDVPESSIREFPVAENLMMGAAMGMSLTGLRPVVTVERADFLWCCMDSIRNHIDAVHQISRGEFQASVLIRVVIGNSQKPLFTGPTHTSNPSNGLRQILNMPIFCPGTAYEVREFYQYAHQRMEQNLGSTMIFESKDRY